VCTKTPVKRLSSSVRPRRTSCSCPPPLPPNLRLNSSLDRGGPQEMGILNGECWRADWFRITLPSSQNAPRWQSNGDLPRACGILSILLSLVLRVLHAGVGHRHTSTTIWGCAEQPRLYQFICGRGCVPSRPTHNTSRRPLSTGDTLLLHFGSLRSTHFNNS
jgi:hypothetical protein